MTTNTGMFRIAPDATKPAPFSGTLETPAGTGKLSEALVTRFIEPDTLLGSGHPAAGEALPAALGLIRSEDAGKTWSSVSELGKADFHAIETSGNTIVAALFGAGAGVRERGRRPHVGDEGGAAADRRDGGRPERLAALDRQHPERHLPHDGRR